MDGLINRSVLSKLLLILALLMPLLVVLEVLPTINAISFFGLAVIGGSIYFWGLKGGIISAFYSSLITLSLLSHAPWSVNSHVLIMGISVYLITGIGGGKVINVYRNQRRQIRV